MSEQQELIASVEEIDSVPVVIDESLSPTDRLIMMAVQGNADIEKLERLIDLKNKEESRTAKIEYDNEFAEMQKEFEPAARSKQGDKGKYAPLDVLQKQYGPVIHEHGFSYRWSEESLEGGGLQVIMTISGHGHSESNHKDLPAYVPDKGASSGKFIMNAMQAEGTRSTYGERYTFIAGFGLIIEDEDTDGKFDFDEGVRYSEYIVSMDAEKDAIALFELVKRYRKELEEKGDTEGAKVVSRYYAKCKERVQ